MKRILLIGLALMNIISISVHAEMIDGIDYRQAQESDVQAVVSVVLDEIAILATDRVLLPPRACFKQFVEDMIRNKYLFIAVKKINDKDVVVATKKLFVAEGADKKDILENLIRAEGPKVKKLSLRGKINNDGNLTVYPDYPQAPQRGVDIYVGFEYTRKDFQNQSINWYLTELAYKEIANSVRNALQKSPVKNVTLLYVLAYPNAGAVPGARDRNRSLAVPFQAFIKKYLISNQASPVVLELSRYDSFLRVFKEDSPDCTTPLADKDPMYGFALTYTLK